MMSDFGKSTTPQLPVHSVTQELRLIDILRALGRQKKLLILTPVVCTVLAVAVFLVLKPVYTSNAVILPPQQQSSGMSAMLGQLGGLASATGGLGGALKNPNDLYVGMLESRTVADKLVEKFKLSEHYDVKTAGLARKKLSDKTTIVSEKSGLIFINVSDRDSERAAQIANAYVEELSNLTETMALTDASRRRVFFGKQLISAKEQLADAEVMMRKMQEKTGLIQLEGQLKVIIASTAELEAQIAAKQVKLTSLRSYATKDNPELIKIQDELRGLNQELAKSKKGSGAAAAYGDVVLPSGKIPELSTQYVRAIRDVKYYETIFELLAKQFELAKIEEAKNSNIVQLLDKAIPAETRTSPKLILFLAAGIGGGIFLGFMLALGRDFYIRWKRENFDLVNLDK